LSNIARALDKLHRYDEAVTAGERGLAIERRIAPGSRGLATSLANFSEVHVNNKRCDRALPLLREALAIQEKPENADDPNINTSLAVLGACEIESGKAADGTAHAKRALDNLTAMGRSADVLGEVRLIVARGLWATRDRRAAIAAAEQAERDLEGAAPAGAAALAETRKWLAKHRPR
jgi:tetratricopeptide (TPR) repeat protein